MESSIHDLLAHNIQKRTVAIIENGSWAPTSGKLIGELLSKCKCFNILDNTVSIKSSLKNDQLADIEALAGAITASMPVSINASTGDPVKQTVDPTALFKISYGLYVLTAKDGGKDNGCIINTAMQVTATPLKITIVVNKMNHTHDMIARTGTFNLSVLTESALFGVFERFGFQSGRDADKFAGTGYDDRSANGLRYIPEHTNCVISGKVAESHDYGTHTAFVADVTETLILSKDASLTYDYYFKHIKPKPQATAARRDGYVCKICAYVFEGDELPEDFICPLCKHGAADFDKIV